ncbi:hypothetical protein ACFLQR_00525 [Verrucomicrobiota bacterium]
MNTRTFIIVGIVILCLAVFVFGKEAISYLSGAREYTRAAVKERIPPELEISRLNSMLSRLNKVIDKRKGALVDMQMQAESLEKEIKTRSKRLKEDDALLRKVAKMLAKGQECKNSYVIGGIAYSYAEVDADAKIKAERFRQDRELLAAREETLGHFSEAINDARKVLSDAEVERQGLANQVEGLGIRAERLKTQSQIEAGKDYTGGESLGKAYSSIQRGIADLERRLTKGERLFEIRKTGVAGIDYAQNTVQKSGLEALKEVLQ